MSRRRLFAVGLFILSLLLWAPRSDTLRLVINERAVLFNRYGEGHFVALLLTTLLLWVLVACLLSRRPLRQLLAGVLIGTISTVVTVIAAFHLTRWMSKPRYIETPVSISGANQNAAPETSAKANLPAPVGTGIVRHRPPNTRVEWLWQDRPQHPRSYDNPPRGYRDVRTVLTTDANGFRNRTLLPRYDVVIAGDSFAAGSHVSDEQVWTELMARQYDITVYNLGASGASPITYLNNFKRFADSLKPKVAVFVIYEGNDFKAESVEDAADLAATRAFAKAHAGKNASNQNAEQQEADGFMSFSERMKTWSTINLFNASPIRQGLNQLSKRYFETAFADRPLRDYEKVSQVMPVLIKRDGNTHAYAYKSRRLIYLYMTEEAFRKSAEWQASAAIFDTMVAEGEKQRIKPAFVYVPSTPHVVLPIANRNPQAVPAQQLHTFASFARRHLPEPDVFKRELFERLDSQEKVFLNECGKKGHKCLSLTRAFQEAVDAGIQPYYSYDQHWTPEGNMIAAREVGVFLRSIVDEQAPRPPRYP